MKIQATANSTHLTVQVDLTNPTDEVIYVFNWLSDWYGVLNDPKQDRSKNRHAAPTRQLAYVCLGAHDEAVLLNGIGPGPGPGVSLMQPRRPLGTRLKPRERFTNTLQLPLPLMEWHAHEPPSADNTRPVSIFKLQYRLEWLLHSKTEDLLEITAWPGVWRVSGSELHTLEATTELASPITLLARTDLFPRFG
jgi:hypothetical protein